MEESEGRFNRVYTDLKGRIISGQFPAGSSFLSAEQLRQEYQIGFHTARNVTARLREEGYIVSRNRKAPVVCWEGSVPSTHSAVCEVLSHRGSLLELYESLTVILPPLLTFVSQSCDFWLLPHYAQLKKTAIRKMRPQNWRLLPLICQELFDASGNPFFSEIYARFHRYSHLPFFLEAEDSYLCEMLEDTEEFLSVLTSNHPKKKYDWLTASQQRTALAVHDTLYRLEKKYPSCHLPEEEPFQWTGLYERTPVYVQILQDLITKITTGAYPLEQYLPHEEDLAREYGVALTTLRKAMAELRSMGYIRTYNVKGSIAQKRPVEAARHTVQNPVHRQNAFRFLYALQFLALIAGPIAHRAAPGFTTKSLEEIEFQVQQPGAVPITVLADAISRNLDLEPLRVIFRETEHLVRWSYCAFSERNAGQQKRHMLTHVQSALNALKASDKDSFANAVAGYYSNAFSQICAQYVQYYKIKDAKSIVSPSYEWLQ